ncbi:group 1 truncated hemoglobin [bacterium]|nr:group 1 truncated hemoglobin [bacterium]
MSQKLYDKLGGRGTLTKVHKVFYDDLFAHPWLKTFFKGLDQTILENQQSDFMSEAMGGPKCYFGRFPIPTHKNMFITEEIFMLRHKILESSILACGVHQELCEQWLKIDKAFQNGLVKKSINDCEKRFNTDVVMVVQKPHMR